MNQENKPETIEHKIDSSLIVAAHENAGNHNYSHHIYKGFIDGANWQASQRSYIEQKWVSVQEQKPPIDIILIETKPCEIELIFWDNLHKPYFKYWMPKPKPSTEQAALCNTYPTPPTYTQEQILAFGERVKEECILQAEVRSLEDDSHHVYEWIVDEQSILSIDISKLLKK